MNRLAIRREATRILTEASDGRSPEQLLDEFEQLVERAKQTDESRLVGCPFCGSHALYLTRVETYVDADLAVFCNSCKATVTWETIEGTGDEQTEMAIKNWNTRAEPETGDR